MNRSNHFVLICSAVATLVADSNGMQIFVKTQSEEILTLEVEPAEKIHEVKVKIQQEMEGFLHDQQRLLFAEKLLENDKTLADYNIHEGSKLQLLRLTTSGGSEMQIFVKRPNGKYNESRVQ